MHFMLKYYSERMFYGISTRAPGREPVAQLLAKHGLELARHQPWSKEREGKMTLGGLALAARSHREGGA